MSIVGVLPPTAGMSEAEIANLSKSIRETAMKIFNDELPMIQQKLLQYEPLSLLAHLSFYFLTFTTETGPPPPNYPKILQHHVELLQALALQHDRASFPWMPSFPDLVGFLEQVDNISHAFYLQRLAPVDDVQDQRRLQLQEEMRIHTQAVRNWGYPDQIWRIVAELFRPLDDKIEAYWGVRAADLVTLCQRLVALTDDRIRAHIKRLGPVSAARTKTEALDAHQRAYPDLASQADHLETFLAAIRPTIGLSELKELLLSHLNLRIADVYTFDLDDFIAAYPAPVNPERLASVIDRWSLRFGDLRGNTPDEFFVDNPVWTRPFIRLDEGQFFCPVPGMLLSFCLELMERLVQDLPSVRQRYQEVHRGQYLETEIERLFRQAFPTARVFRGSQWSDPADPATIYENDLLVLLDTYMIVVEAKGGSVTKPTRQGKSKRLQHDINKLLVAPATQARRFAAFLHQHPGPHRLSTKRGTINEVDARGVRETICLSVTLDQIGRLYSRWPALRDAGLVKTDVDLWPTVALVDLESIFDVLEGECQRLHYLVRRAEIERTMSYVGGELDLLALYLDTGFNVGDLEFGDNELLLIGDAARLNPYLLRRTTGANPAKPRLRITEWWRAIVRRVEATKPPRWAELGINLLNVAYEEQERFETRFAATQQSVLTNWQTPGHEDVLYSETGPEKRRGVVVGLAVRRLPPAELSRLIGQVADRAFELVAARRGVIIVSDVLIPLYPYRAIALVELPSDVEATSS